MSEAISEVSICNSALIKLGQKTLIEALTEDSDNARLCQNRYPTIRNSVLEDHPWHFATKLAELAPVSDVEIENWTYAFQKPADFLVMQRGEDWDQTFDTIDGYLVADDNPFKIKYTWKVTNTGLYTFQFAESVAWRLAADLAYALTNSTTVSDQMMKGYEMQLKAARFSDSHKKSPEGPFANTWIDVRN